ncbi:MAG: transposase [Oligoflexales bacterium]
MSDIAKSLGISQGVLGCWVQQERDRAQGPVRSEDSKRIKELEAENRKLRMEKEVLKKAITFFGQESK